LGLDASTLTNVRRVGTFVAPDLVNDGLHLIIRHDGKDYRIRIPWSVARDADFLTKVKDFLSPHKNKPMRVIEALETNL
jgi:hypothetical protein